MHEERVKKIIYELVSFSIELKASEINISLRDHKNYVEIEMTTNATNVSKSMINKIEDTLSNPRSAEIEELYWELTDANRHFDQLYLIGIMTDYSYVNYDKTKGLKIVLYRKIK